MVDVQDGADVVWYVRIKYHMYVSRVRCQQVEFDQHWRLRLWFMLCADGLCWKTSGFMFPASIHVLGLDGLSVEYWENHIAFICMSGIDELVNFFYLDASDEFISNACKILVELPWLSFLRTERGCCVQMMTATQKSESSASF